MGNGKVCVPVCSDRIDFNPDEFGALPVGLALTRARDAVSIATQRSLEIATSG